MPLRAGWHLGRSFVHASFPTRCIYGLVPVMLGIAVASLDVPDAIFWLVALWVIWATGAVLVWGQRPFSLGMAFLLALSLVDVVLPATAAARAGQIGTAGVDLTAGLVSAIILAMLAVAGLVVGGQLARLPGRHPTRSITSLGRNLRAVRFAMVGFLLAGGLGLIAFVLQAGADLPRLNVFASGTEYGDFARSTNRQGVEYARSLQSLVGIALMFAVLAFRLGPSKGRRLPIATFVVGVIFLGLSGQRELLLVPLSACRAAMVEDE